MALYMAASAQNDTGGLSIPAMTIIAMLLLMLPYLIYRYTGKSVTEYLRLSFIFSKLEDFFAGIRGAVLKKPSDSSADRPASGKSRELPEKEKNSGAKEDRARSAYKHQAAQVKNDYLRTISAILNFARKNRLFAIVPGNVEYRGQAASLTAIVVTRSRIIGVQAYGFDGRIFCRRGDGEWEVEENGSRRSIGKLAAETKEQDALVVSAMRQSGLETSAYKTAIVLTGSNAVLCGERPPHTYTTDEFFASLETEADLRTGPIDPKETGGRINLLRKGKRKK
jgi:hypothetical protein